MDQQTFSSVQTGTRNNTLNSYALTLSKAGASMVQICSELHHTNQAFSKPLLEKELNLLLASYGKKV